MEYLTKSERGHVVELTEEEHNILCRLQDAIDGHGWNFDDVCHWAGGVKI